MLLGEAALPSGLRIYAIGDVHGRDDLLAAAHDRLAADLADRPIADHRVIHMGDYVDRGADSAAVIDRLVAWQDAPETICLKGNHEDLLETFLATPIEGAADFLGNGGIETLASYGVAAWPDVGPDAAVALRDAFVDALPEAHRRFLAGLVYSASFGDYFFCHAGIRPGIPLDQQDPDDLIWIRGTFHRDTGDHGKVVVHAHTPVPEPDIRPNRINIDTGAWYTGRLTCLVLEGTDYRFI